MEKVEKIINLFEENLRLCSDESFYCDIDTNKPKEYWSFINQYLRNNKDKVINRREKIYFNLIGEDKNIKKFLCGIAPMWKEYESQEAFECYYTQSDMMRELFCNEKDNDGKLIPMYISLNGEKNIVAWESNKNIDTFRYRVATAEERGLLDIFSEIFGNNKTLDSNVLGFCSKIAITFDKRIQNNNIGYDMGLCKSICDTINDFGYKLKGQINVQVG